MKNHRNSRALSSLLVALASLALVFLLPACPKTESPEGGEGTKKEEKKGDGHEEGDHEECEHEEEDHEGEKHEGEEHGDSWLIDIGEHTFLGDVDFDSEDGILTITVLDHHDKEPHAHEVKPVTLNLVLAGGSKQLSMKALRGDEDLEGETTRYTITDPGLKGLKELKGRVNMTIDGKEYICDLKAAH
ncbi:MAG: hypothetical protein ACYTFG_03655 [Planctomycetota bacterium]|jgi:hypothetical protein